MSFVQLIRIKRKTEKPFSLRLYNILLVTCLQNWPKEVFICLVFCFLAMLTLCWHKCTGLTQARLLCMNYEGWRETNLHSFSTVASGIWKQSADFTYCQNSAHIVVSTVSKWKVVLLEPKKVAEGCNCLLSD